jgi:hypothetical protein
VVVIVVVVVDVDVDGFFIQPEQPLIPLKTIHVNDHVNDHVNVNAHENPLTANNPENVCIGRSIDRWPRVRISQPEMSDR